MRTLVERELVKIGRMSQNQGRQEAFMEIFLDLLLNTLETQHRIEKKKLKKILLILTDSKKHTWMLPSLCGT